VVITTPTATVSGRLLFRQKRCRAAPWVLNEALADRAKLDPFINDSRRHLSPRSKLPPIIAMARRERRGQARGILRGMIARHGEAEMARFEIAEIASAALGSNTGADVFFELGMTYATGRSVPPDLVTAHKWFNIAAMRGNKDAVRHRREIAAEMSEAEIATAQRAARDWLRANEAGADTSRAAA
jgi:uncharacterized protein